MTIPAAANQGEGKKSSRILLTGATGYIGRRLQDLLLKDEKVKLRIFVRNARKATIPPETSIEIIEGSTLEPDALERALKNIDVAYYLIHSMGATGDFEAIDRISAKNFREAAIRASVKRIIYLGGLGDKTTASKHLRSRLETGEILSAHPTDIQTIWFRAGIIIGSGSASFEIIRNLIQKLPMMITPRWVRTLTQPISVSDVLQYLYQARDVAMDGNGIVDIGSEIMSFKDLMSRASRVMGLHRIYLPVPFLSPRLSSFWLRLFSPVPSRIARALVDGLKSETIIQNDNARKYFPRISPIPFAQSVRLALEDIDKNQILSSWCDSSAGAHCDLEPLPPSSQAVLTYQGRHSHQNTDPSRVFASIQKIGGRHGWFSANWLWRLRGLIDKLIGGPGLNRGRRDHTTLRIGDSLDFWKVADLRPDKRLLLSSQMKLPGKAWLEFLVEEKDLILKAHFLPHGIWGRLYWTLTKPFHLYLFPRMMRKIIQQAGNTPPTSPKRDHPGHLK